VYLLDAVHGVLGQDLEKGVSAQLTLQNAELLVDGILYHELAQLTSELAEREGGGDWISHARYGFLLGDQIARPLFTPGCC